MTAVTVAWWSTAAPLAGQTVATKLATTVARLDRSDIQERSSNRERVRALKMKFSNILLRSLLLLLIIKKEAKTQGENQIIIDVRRLFTSGSYQKTIPEESNEPVVLSRQDLEHLLFGGRAIKITKADLHIPK